MTALPAETYITDAARNEAEDKQWRTDIRNVLAEMLGAQAPTELTIASGSVTASAKNGGQHTIDTESDAATDDLDNIVITNTPDGRWLFISAADAGRTVVIKHESGGSGQISLQSNADFSLDDTDKWLLLRLVGTTWTEVIRGHRANQAEAEAGTDDSGFMTALRVKQAIDALGGGVNVNNGVLTPYEALVCKYVSASTVDVDADALLVKNSNGDAVRLEGINHTVDITASGLNGLDQGSEASSTWYTIWEIYDGTTKGAILSSCQERTTDGTTAGKLVDSSEAFDTDGTAVGDPALNTTDNTRTVVTAIDSAGVLSVRDDIFASGDDYVIVKSPKMPSGYTYKGLVGFVSNNGSNDFDNFIQTGNKVVAVNYAPVSTGTATSFTAVSLEIPILATLIHGAFYLTDTDTMATGYIAATSSGLGSVFCRTRFTNGLNAILSHHYTVPVVEPQTTYYSVSAGDSATLHLSGWEY